MSARGPAGSPAASETSTYPSFDDEGGGPPVAPAAEHRAARPTFDGRVITYVSARPLRALVAVFLLSFAGAAAISFLAGRPRPRVHDEFSYLLAADTYAHGRIANPPHPHWRHFEAPHVIHQPTYASKYPPAQGLFLALGQIVFGHAIAGVWLTVALMSAAVTWMLQAWLSARWALLGGVLTALQFGVAGAWAQSYWGGAVAATGGALLFGALGRVWRSAERDASRSPPDEGAGAATSAGGAKDWLACGAAFAAGSTLLALSRPFEGVVVFAVVLVSLLAVGSRSRIARRVAIAGVVGAAGVGGVVTAVHNRAVTGDPLTLPYQLHTRQYSATPLFVFQPLPPAPDYTNERLARFHLEWERRHYERQRTITGWVYHAFARPLTAAKDFVFGPPRNLVDRAPIGAWIPGVLALPLLLGPWLLRRRKASYAFLVVFILFAALSTTTYFVPHYVAVLAPLWMYLVVESVRLCRVAAPSNAVRAAVVPFAVALSIVLACQSALGQASRSGPDSLYRLKERIEERLDAVGGRHLVIVLYGQDVSFHRELVYNSADIDGQEVVWAHPVSVEADMELLEYYAERRAWTLLLTGGTAELRQIERDGS